MSQNWTDFKKVKEERIKNGEKKLQVKGLKEDISNSFTVPMLKGYRVRQGWGLINITLALTISLATHKELFTILFSTFAIINIFIELYFLKLDLNISYLELWDERNQSVVNFMQKYNLLCIDDHKKIVVDVVTDFEKSINKKFVFDKEQNNYDLHKDIYKLYGEWYIPIFKARLYALIILLVTLIIAYY